MKTTVILVKGKNPNVKKAIKEMKVKNADRIVFTDIGKQAVMKLCANEAELSNRVSFPKRVKGFDIEGAMAKANFEVIGTVADQMEKLKKCRNTEQKWIDAGYHKEDSEWVNTNTAAVKHFCKVLGYKSGKLPWFVAAKLYQTEILWQFEEGFNDNLNNYASESTKRKWKTDPDFCF